MTYGFIGTGNMGGALARALVREVSPLDVYLNNRTPAKAEALAAELGARADTAAHIAAACDYIFLGVKPNLIAGVLAQLAPTLAQRTDKPVLVSMAAGERANRCVYSPGPVLQQIRRRFGLVFQNFNLFPQYTARQNVMLASELLAKEQPDYKAQKKLLHAQIAARAEELLTQVGLKEKMDLYPHQLSGGQQQRVAIARALALQPDILCFDEPTSALDPELTGEVLKVIRSLSEQHMTMIIVTHEMAFARDVANRVIFMDGGVIVEQGPARDVIENPQAERTKQFLARYRENQ